MVLGVVFGNPCSVVMERKKEDEFTWTHKGLYLYVTGCEHGLVGATTLNLIEIH